MIQTKGHEHNTKSKQAATATNKHGEGMEEEQLFKQWAYCRSCGNKAKSLQRKTDCNARLVRLKNKNKNKNKQTNKTKQNKNKTKQKKQKQKTKKTKQKQNKTKKKKAEGQINQWKIAAKTSKGKTCQEMKDRD